MDTLGVGAAYSGYLGGIFAGKTVRGFVRRAAT
jgi:hypothetical protein